MTAIRPTENEGSTSKLTVEFFNYNNAPETPASITYRIDCLTSGAEILADTSISVASSVDIEITAVQNAIQDQTNGRERRLVTVKATYGAVGVKIEKFEYYVRNLKKVS